MFICLSVESNFIWYTTFQDVMYLFLIMWRMKAEIGGKLFLVYQLFVKFIWITYIYTLYVCVNM